MAAEEKRTGLGRGLSALLGDDDAVSTPAGTLHGYRNVPVESLRPGKMQPRLRIDDAALRELADSIREKGILQPILVRPHPEDPAVYELIAGERRWRAAQLAQIHEVPVIVKELSDGEAMEIALIENLQRQDLSPVEEAEGYRRLMEEFHHTQQDMARVIGKSRSHVANTLRLLALPGPVKKLLDEGSLTAGHARALLTADAPEQLADQVVRNGLSVRETEKLAQTAKSSRPARPRPESRKDADTLALERDVSQLLGLKVQIQFGPGGGKLTLHYDSLDQLDDILHRLSHGLHGNRRPAAIIDDIAADENAVNPEADTTLLTDLDETDESGFFGNDDRERN